MKSVSTLVIVTIIGSFFDIDLPYEAELREAKKEIARLNDTLKGYQGTMEDYRKQWDTFGKQMVEASDKLDPLYLKGLFRKNETLSLTNEELKRLLGSGGYGGILFLDTEQLILRISRFLGDLWISVEVDPGEGEPNVIVSREYRSTNPSLLFSSTIGRDYLTAIDRYYRSPNGTYSIENWAKRSVSLQPGNLMATVDKRYHDQATRAFTNFLQMNTYETPTADDQKEWALRDILRRSG